LPGLSVATVIAGRSGGAIPRWAR